MITFLNKCGWAGPARLLASVAVHTYRQGVGVCVICGWGLGADTYLLE